MHALANPTRLLRFARPATIWLLLTALLPWAYASMRRAEAAAAALRRK